MRVVLAVNHEELESYIESIPELTVCEIFKTGRNIIKECKTIEPDVLILSHTLPGISNNKEFISKLTSKDFANLRIVYLYGEDNRDRKQFINFLVSRGVYDYKWDDLNTSSLDELIFHPKTRDQVINDIVDNVADSDNEIAITIDNIESPKKSNSKAPKTKIIREFHTLKQKVISFTGSSSCGKTTVAINVGLSLAKNLNTTTDTNVLLIDFDFIKPEIAFHLDIENTEKSLDSLKLDLKSRNLNSANLENYLIIPFKEYPNFKVLTGFIDYTDSHLDIDPDDINYLLNIIKNKYDLILFDTDGNTNNSWTKYIIQQSNLNVLVTELSISQLEHLKRIQLKMNNMDNVMPEKENTLLVVNKYFAAKELELSDIQETLEMLKENTFPIPANVPLFTDAINKSIPVIVSNSSENEIYINSINNIASHIQPIKVDTNKRSLFSKIKLPFFPKKH